MRCRGEAQGLVRRRTAPSDCGRATLAELHGRSERLGGERHREKTREIFAIIGRA